MVGGQGGCEDISADGITLTVPQNSSIRSGGSVSSISLQDAIVFSTFSRNDPSPSAAALASFPAEKPNVRSRMRSVSSASAMDSDANMIWLGV